MKPLILDFKVNRSENQQPILYEYDAVRCMNVVTVNGTKKPFIEINSSDSELMTKTKVRQESDDDSFSISTLDKGTSLGTPAHMVDMLLELSTKTLVKTERDDERRDYLT